MAMTPEEISEFVRADFPDGFLKKELRGVFAAHKDATDEAYRRYADSEAENVVGGMRRASMEMNFRGAAEMTPGLTPVVKKIPGTGWNYTEIHAGQSVLVAKAVTHPGAMIDKAAHRETLAQPNQDALPLWADVEEIEPAKAEPHLFTVLTHSRYSSHPLAVDLRENRHLPGSAHLVVPSPDQSFYLWEMNLFDEFPDIVREHLPNKWDESAVVKYMHYARSATYKWGNKA